MERRVCVLIVGAEGVGKNKLGRALLSMKHSKVAVTVQTTTSLSVIGHQEYCNIHYVIFVVDMRSEHSWATVEASICKLDAIYFHGRCCIVVLEVKKPYLFALTLDQVEEKAAMLEIPTFFGSAEELADLSILSDQLLNTIVLNCGACSDITPGVLRAGIFNI